MTAKVIIMTNPVPEWAELPFDPRTTGYNICIRCSFRWENRKLGASCAETTMCLACVKAYKPHKKNKMTTRAEHEAVEMVFSRVTGRLYLAKGMT